MTDRKPRLDVIIANRDYGEYLDAAIGSALAQEGTDVRVVVVDDASSDHSLQVARAWDSDRVTVIPLHTHVGQCAARNIGMKESSSPWIAFLDADDLWPAGRTGALLAALDGERGTIAYGGQALCDASGRTLDRRQETGRFINCALIPREVMDRVGTFDESLTYGGNIDWTARAWAAGVPDVLIDDVALHRRIHDRNMSRQISADPQDYLTIVRRHRGANGGRGGPLTESRPNDAAGR